VLESARFRRYIEIQPVFLDLPTNKACYMYLLACVEVILTLTFDFKFLTHKAFDENLEHWLWNIYLIIRTFMLMKSIIWNRILLH